MAELPVLPYTGQYIKESIDICPKDMSTSAYTIFVGQDESRQTSHL
ncbi:MAG: hypothetical protein BAJATHORv1_60163, partial [Candidatus Thorarchaeota archaeon]